ncbi:hypothetical protein [Sulfurimonas indica]|uniref:hypothetical protein n=1 Tax=Sulfurimonas TaxID=202746 RepID=UPI00165FF61A|nr:hypothetical protein [Sulfurimonas indica]
MNTFERVKVMIKPQTVDYGHIQTNKKNIQTLRIAKKEIEKKLKKENIKNDR